MPKLKKEVDKGDFAALCTLFREVTGVDPETVLEGSLTIVEGTGDERFVLFNTITPDDPETPPREHIYQINPAEKIQEEL